MIRDIRRLLPSSSEQASLWLFVLHLLTVWALAISNAFMALTALVGLPSVRRAPWRRFAPALRPLGLYALFVLAAIAGSYDPRSSLGGARELLSLLTLPMAFMLLRDEQRVRRLVDAVVVMGALLATFGLVQLLMGFGGLYQRIRGPFSHWMTFAGVLVICLLLAAARLAHRPGGAGRAWRWAALAVMAAALVLSLTRSAWVALLVALLVLLALRAPRYLAAVPAVGLLLVLLAPVPVVARMTSVFDLRTLSNYDRLCMAEAGLLMISEKPFFGIGPEMVRLRYPIYHHPSAPRRSTPHLHNSFLQIGAENGLPALAAYLWLMGGTALLAFRRFRAEGGWAGDRADLHVGVVLVLLGFNLVGLFEDNWADTEVQRLVLFVLAVPHCLTAAGEKDEREGAAA